MGKGKGKKKAAKAEKELPPEITAFLAASGVTVDEGENEEGAAAAKEGSDKKKKKGRKDRSGSSKGSKRSKGSKKKGKKGKKDKKKIEEPPVDDKPKYTQKDIDDYLKAKEKKKRKQREQRLVEKMQNMVSLVRPNDPRWNTWSLAPLYRFLHSPRLEVVTIFLRKVETKKEDKKLVWANEDDDADESKRESSANRQSTKLLATRLSAHRKPLEDSITESRNSVMSGLEKQSMDRLSSSRSQKAPPIVGGYQLIVMNDVIPNDSPDMFYFVKLRQVAVDRDNFFEDVLFGNIPGGYLTSLNSLMSYVLTPMFYTPHVLPESVRNDFFAVTNRFMSCITETHNRLMCQTVLFVPHEALGAPIDIVSKDKELCSRLEAAMVHWIRQIKEVVNNQTMQDGEDWSEPLDEIAFWQSRNEDLAGLTAQIKSVPVQTVQQIMTIIKSPFVSSFNMISSEILGASAEAISNLYYLNIINEPCQKLHESKIADIPDQLQNILWLIRIVWLNSPYYNTRERLNGLLRKVSNGIISHCIKEIDIDQVFNGHISSSEAIINQCMDCLKFWKTKYFEAQKMHSMNSYLTWFLEYDHILSHVDVFVHRLQDLQEICVCQRLYARRVEGYQEPLPTYPGKKSLEISKVMKKVQKTLDSNLKDMYAAGNLILNVRNTQWHDYMMMFKAAVRDIEMMIQNVLFFAFDSVATLEQGIQLLETFYVFYQRDIITRAYDKLIMKLYKLLEDECNQVRALFQLNIQPPATSDPKYVERGTWTLYLQRGFDVQRNLVKAAWWLPECGYGEDVTEQARILSRTLGEFSQTMYRDWEISIGLDNLRPRLVQYTDKFGRIEATFDKQLEKYVIEVEMWKKVDHSVPDVLVNVLYERVKIKEYEASRRKK